MNVDIIANWFTGFAEAYFLFILFDTFMERRGILPQYIYPVGIIVLAVLTNICNILFSISVINLAIIVLLYISSSYLYNSKFNMRVLTSAMSMMIGVVVEVAVLFLLAAIFNRNVSDIIRETDTRLVGIILSKLFCYAIIKYISIKFKKSIVKFDISYWVLFAVIFSSTTFAMFTFCKITELNTSIYVRNLVSVSSVGLCIAAFVILILYENTLKQKATIMQKQWSEIHLQEQIKHYDNIMMTQGQVKTIRHDLENHLLSIRSIIQNDGVDKSINYIDSLLESIDLSRSYIDTGNTVLDAIINAKKTEAERKGIDFYLKIRIPEQLPISHEDECIIFGNALDNAIEAAVKAPEEKYISLSLIFDKDALMCKITNSYDGNNSATTHKGDIHNHGIGKDNMNKALEKYNSVSKVINNINEYALIIIIMGLNMD